MDENKCLFGLDGMLKTDICHHGVKGQKWGVRRYQNPDGSLTDAGKKRYLKNGSLTEKGKRKIDVDKYNEYENKKSIVATNTEKIKSVAPNAEIDKDGWITLKPNTKASNGGKIRVTMDTDDLDDGATEMAKKIFSNPKKYADIGVEEIKRLIKEEMKDSGYMYETDDPEKVVSGVSVHLSPMTRGGFEAAVIANYTYGHNLIAELYKDENGQYRSTREGLEWYG